jgi:hypothetical protein
MQEGPCVLSRFNGFRFRRFFGHPLAFASSIRCLALALAWLNRVLLLRSSLLFSLYFF